MNDQVKRSGILLLLTVTVLPVLVVFALPLLVLCIVLIGIALAAFLVADIAKCLWLDIKERVDLEAKTLVHEREPEE